MKDRKRDRLPGVRVSPALFKELDDKRHAHREYWQSLQLRLLQEWLRSDRDPAENFYTRRPKEHEMLDFIYDMGTKDDWKAIVQNLKHFNKSIGLTPQRTPEGQRRIREKFREEQQKQDKKKDDKTG